MTTTTEEATAPTTPEEPATLSFRLALPPSERNLASVTRAAARLIPHAWAPLGGYPGSDIPWQLRCLLCGWEGERFYSHLRGRNGGAPRPKYRHRDCLPEADRYARQKAWNQRLGHAFAMGDTPTGPLPDGRFRAGLRTLGALAYGTEEGQPSTAVQALTKAIAERSRSAEELFHVTIP